MSLHTSPNTGNNNNISMNLSESNENMAVLTNNYMKKLQELQQYRHFLNTTKHFIDLDYFYINEMDVQFVNEYQQMLQQQKSPNDIKQLQVKYLQSKNNKLVDDLNNMKALYKQGIIQYQQRKYLPQLRQIQTNREQLIAKNMSNSMPISSNSNSNIPLEATQQLKLQQQQQQLQQQKQFQQALNHLNANPNIVNNQQPQLQQQQHLMNNMNANNSIETLLNNQIKQQQMAMQTGTMNALQQQQFKSW
ncbi:hypothetical protein QEN19_000570 [Hanseniaspora menglaensis]